MRSMFKFAIFIIILLACMGSTVFAGGKPEVPRIPPLTSGTQYLSPNGDGVKESATIDFSVTVYVKSKEGYVPEYGLEIKDSNGNIIKNVVEELGLGLTVIHGAGGFSKKPCEILYITAERLSLNKLKSTIFAIDPTAFIAIQDLHEVSGGTVKAIPQQKKKHG